MRVSMKRRDQLACVFCQAGIEKIRVGLLFPNVEKQLN